MAVVHRVKRIANPRGRRVKVRRVRVPRNAKGRFTKVKRVKRAVRHRKNPVRLSVRRKVRKVRRAVRRRANPFLIELGTINPHHFTRRKRVAKRIRRRRSTARRANPRRRRAVAKRVVRRRRRANPVVHRRRRRRTAVMHHVRRRRRSSNPRRRMSYRRRRNPAVFGQSGKSLLMMTGGVLIGVAATKYLPTLIPSSITGMLGTSSVATVLFTVAGAFAAQFIAKKVSSNTAFTDAVLLGGLSLAASRALDAFAPTQLSSALALTGMGDIVPGWFAVPQNSVTNRAPAPMMIATKGVGRAFGGGFGNRR